MDYWYVNYYIKTTTTTINMTLKLEAREVTMDILYFESIYESQ